MSKYELRSMYIPHARVQQDPGPEPSKTRQDMQEECDVNALMARYDKAGVWPNDNAAEPRYLDCSEVPDFRSAMDFMIEADKAFMSLPATVRREFDNNSADFVDYATDPANVGQMREWGLAPPEKTPDAPMRVEVVNPPAPPPDVPKGS